ncbi:MAG: 2-hydroxyacyl-CoA dehydratase [Deltaproteobacteria bacterium]|nr:2-hydroxyacyl-CoA dehydratase [Deltaproteobacteria bacterium]
MVGITSTIPVEIVLAAGLRPLDLNNLFISAADPEEWIQRAEAEGFAHNLCAWIKGIYTATLLNGVKRVIAVTGGDCSNTVALGEVLATRGVEVIPFSYPMSRRREAILEEMELLRRSLATTWEAVGEVKTRLDRIRRRLVELDRLTYERNVVSGGENHRFLVSSSDFGSDPDRFEKDLDAFLEGARTRSPFGEEIRLGFLGVPPVFEGLYEFLECLGGRVVFNEVQRQFSMPYGEEDLVSQYLRYTYPYRVTGRVEDIRSAVLNRRLDGLIHYTQTFCFRQIHDILLRKYLPLPMVTIEGDRPGPLDGRTATRLETFMEMLKARRSCR